MEKQQNTTKQKTSIYERLHKAQQEMQKPKKASDNPFYKSKYANLEDVVDACYPALHNNGLFVSQQLQISEGQQILNTKIYDTEGQYIESNVLVIFKDPTDPQKMGSGITYARRYALSAILGLTTEEDDDGNIASGKASSGTKTPPASEKQVKMMVSLEALLPEEAVEQYKGWLLKSYNTEDVATLNIEQASEVISALKAKTSK